MNKMALNYESPQSLETIDLILAYLIGRPLHGATQQQIADMLNVSIQTANRFVQHLERKGKVHTAIKAQSRGRNSPAVYKHGPMPPQPLIPKWCVYRDLPHAFFKSTKPKRKRKMNTTKTDWFNANEFAPTRQGAYECAIVRDIGRTESVSEETHKRWFDGQRWSWPLQPDHEREDGFVKPHENYFMSDNVTQSFVFRGFVEDQEPL
jgi:hypothetical protein